MGDSVRECVEVVICTTTRLVPAALRLESSRKPYSPPV